MGQFRLVISYENPRCAETFEVQAEGLSEAESMCERMVSEQGETIRRLESRNVYSSKRACGCEVQNTASSSFITTVT